MHAVQLPRDESSALEKLRESEQRFHAAIEAVQGVLWTNNAHGEMVGEQSGWASLTGQSFHEYQGYGWSRAVHPEDAEPTIEAWKAAVEAQKTFIFEHRVRRQDGEWRLFAVRAVPVLDGLGNIREWVGVHTDITDQRAAEHALLDVTASFAKRARTAMAARDRTWNNARDLLAILDASGIIRAANPAWTSLLGWPAADIAGKNLIAFIHPAESANAKEAIAAASVGVLRGYECLTQHLNGTYRCISWVAAPDNDLIYVNGRDVTAANEARKALEGSEARMRAIFETAYELRGIIALDGTVLDANLTSLNAIQTSLEDVIGKPFWDTPWFTSTPGMPELVRKAISRVAKGETFREEIFLNLSRGRRWFDFTIRPVRDIHGEIVAIVPEAADITARRQAEEALRKSQKLEAIGELTGGIAHDFNNLLTPIVGTLDLLQRRYKSDERAVKLISGALKSADRASTLVQRLLAFSRRQHLQARIVDVRELVSGVVDLIGRSLGSRIETRVKIEEGLPPVKVDPNQLELAILNLAVNSRDAMPDGGILTITAESAAVGEKTPELAPGPYVCLAVADTGEGMPSETLERAIEPFFSTKGGRGTGLGLSMVHGLAAQSGGKLTLESTRGKGTIATLWLPVSREAPWKKSGGESAGEQTARPLSILLADDHDLVRTSTAEMLDSMGHVSVQVHSGEAALRQLAFGEDYDLLITDYMMPGMTGVELAAKAREMRPGLPAILMTGYDASSGEDAAGLIRLAKPFQSNDLARAIATAAKDI